MMQKILEDYLWSRMGYAGLPGIEYPNNIIKDMIALGMIKSEKQAWRTLEKWSSKGIYDYGSRLDLVWKVKPKDNAELDELTKLREEMGLYDQ